MPNIYINIYNKFETTQSELKLSDDTDYSVDRQQFEDQYFEVKAKFNELLHAVMDPPSRRSSPRSSLSGHSNHTPRSHKAAHTLNFQSLHCQPSKVTHVAGYITETLLRH